MSLREHFNLVVLARGTLLGIWAFMVLSWFGYWIYTFWYLMVVNDGSVSWVWYMLPLVLLSVITVPFVAIVPYRNYVWVPVISYIEKHIPR